MLNIGGKILTKFDFQPYLFEGLARRGAKNDGGYLIPINIKADLLISFGLGNDWKFELDLVKCKHVRSFVIFDHSQNLLGYFREFIRRLMPQGFQLKALVYRLILLLRYFRDFVIMRNIHIQKKVTKKGNIVYSKISKKEISVTEIFGEFVNDADKKIVLKIDIEGYEYEIIDQVIDYKDDVVLIIIEFHDITLRLDEFKKCLDKLNLHYSLIHSHVNNYGSLDLNSIPQMCEFTFINKTIFIGKDKISKLPRNDLDSPTTPFRNDLMLNFSDK